MTEPHDSQAYLSRGTDHLGFLGAKLRDLEGYSTLAHELIQNADDAPGATTMRFDIRDDALVVDNNGTFSDCLHVEEQECRWKNDPLKGHRCDFHRFRYVASGDKRREEGTTGAFGIGFISVYQITDRPELISLKRHWTLCENEPEERRIAVCQGCQACSEPSLPGTRFFLPWAFDEDSPLRTALMVAPLREENISEFQEQFLKTLPTAMLFLKKIHLVEVQRNGRLVLRIERLKVGSNIILSDGNEDRMWHLLSGTFSEDAAGIRIKYPGKIEAKRTADVTLAIPEVQVEKGLFCVFLPTEEETKLPFHINADFFPSNDRKRIVLGSDYQSEWNRAAIKMAAKILSEHIEQLTELLGHIQFWELVQSAFQVYQDVGKGHGDPALQQFWIAIRAKLASNKTIYTTKREWAHPKGAVFLESKEEEGLTDTFEAMGFCLVHPELRPYHNLLRSDAVGVKLLDVQDIIDRLKAHNLTQRIEPSGLPKWIATDDKLGILCGELEFLFRRARKPGEETKLKAQLAECSLMRGLDGALWPCKDLYKADDDTVSLFVSVDAHIPFADKVPESCNFVRELCPDFSATGALECLERVFESALGTSAAEANVVALLAWFEDRKKDVLSSKALVQRLADLPIFPSKSRLAPLVRLSLPGNFVDPLGLASLIDVELLGGRTDFLKELGAEELDFPRYVSAYIPPALESTEVTIEQKRSLVRLLARHSGEIKDNRDIRALLSGSRVVECSAGSFQKPGTVYMDPRVREVLGDEVLVAAGPSECQESVLDLWRWLGVADRPRLPDILMRVRNLSATAPTTEAIRNMQSIVSHLGERFKDPSLSREGFEELRSIAWLPARGGHTRWFRPREVFAEFQSYLFESQGTFLDLGRNIQNSSAELFQFLGVRTEPPVELVVKHLLACVQNNRQVNREVYRFLNDHAEDRALNGLLGKECLLLQSGVYVGPNKVYWSAHSFGRYRYQLSSDLRGYGALFSRLDVREAPDVSDALSVIIEISDEFAPDNRMLDNDSYAVLIKSWQMLSEALDANEGLRTEFRGLKDRKVIPNGKRILMLPDWMFFEDRAGLSTRFGTFLQNNVIPRPQGASKAMEAVGVQALSSVVKSHLVECTDPVEDEPLFDCLQQRRTQLLRVLETENPGSFFDSSLLEQISFFGVKELKVQYSLNAFGRDKASAPESVPAHYMRTNQSLYYVRQNGYPPWAALGRELALALFPDIEPGRFASGIKEVLSAATVGDAKAMLDELGFPVLETSPEPGAGIVVGGLGGGEITGGVPGGETGSLGGGTAVTNVDEAIKGILGQEPAPPQSPPGGEATETEPGLRAGTEKTEHGGETSKTHGKQKGSQANAGKLRTYVGPGEREPKSESAAAPQHQRDPVEQAGVEYVLQYEHQQGRFPEEKPHNFEGYDVESKDSTGQVARYIEVKARSSLWDTQGVALSKPQFDKARELGAAYWLYVVENAQREDINMFRVQDPGRLANQFFYDRGWEQLAEEASTGPEEACSSVEEIYGKY